MYIIRVCDSSSADQQVKKTAATERAKIKKGLAGHDNREKNCATTRDHRNEYKNYYILSSAVDGSS